MHVVQRIETPQLLYLRETLLGERAERTLLG
jgi:hypothetical protein